MVRAAGEKHDEEEGLKTLLKMHLSSKKMKHRAVLCHAQYMLAWGCMGQYLPLHRSKALFRESCEFNGAFSMGCQQLLCTLRESSKLQLS
jgi:hypothetical protein